MGGEKIYLMLHAFLKKNQAVIWKGVANACKKHKIKKSRKVKVAFGLTHPAVGAKPKGLPKCRTLMLAPIRL